MNEPTPTWLVDVEGGQVAVHELSTQPTDPQAPVVVAVHGITANSLSWVPVAQELRRRYPDGVRVAAPELRGRACSRSVDGPYGIGVDAADIVAVMAAIGRPVVLAGHSLGAFIVAQAATMAPELVAGVVLVDGGFAFPPPAGDLDSALHIMLGPSMQRLAMRFPDEQTYVDFWQPHPAFAPLLAGPHRDAVIDYLVHDLIPDPQEPEQLSSSCVLAAIRADGADLITPSQAHTAVARACQLGLPVEFLWAQRGLMDEPQGLYDTGRLASLALPAAVDVRHVPDTNHFSILLADPGIAVVVDALDRAIIRLT